MMSFSTGATLLSSLKVTVATVWLFPETSGPRSENSLLSLEGHQKTIWGLLVVRLFRVSLVMFTNETHCFWAGRMQNTSQLIPMHSSFRRQRQVINSRSEKNVVNTSPSFPSSLPRGITFPTLWFALGRVPCCMMRSKCDVDLVNQLSAFGPMQYQETWCSSWIDTVLPMCVNYSCKETPDERNLGKGYLASELESTCPSLQRRSSSRSLGRLLTSQLHPQSGGKGQGCRC